MNKRCRWPPRLLRPELSLNQTLKPTPIKEATIQHARAIVTKDTEVGHVPLPLEDRSGRKHRPKVGPAKIPEFFMSSVLRLG